MRRLFLLLVLAAPALAQTMSAVTNARPAAQKWPTTPVDFDIPDFHFRSGETLPKLHLHALTLGTPHRDAAGHVDNAVLLLHGTGGRAESLLNPVFSNELFGPGQPLDIAKFFLILPDDIGHGVSSKPSDGLHMRFPHYDYNDMVASQHRMLVEALHVDHLRLILGTSMGCMQSFVWGETYPGFADALAPFACQAVAMAGRNRMWRYEAIQVIKHDPAWQNGEYTSEPQEALRAANGLLLIAGSAPLQMQKNQPTPAAADRYVDDYLARTMASTDANDLIYQLDASRTYDPSAHLGLITVPVLWINSADDFINPPELGLAQQQVKQMPRGRFILLPISDATRGHGSHTVAALWKNYLAELMEESKR